MAENARIDSTTVLVDHTVLALDLEPLGAGTGDSIGSEFGESLQFGLVGRASDTVSARRAGKTQADAIDAELVARRESDGCRAAILSHGPGTSANRREAAERPARPHQSIGRATCENER